MIEKIKIGRERERGIESKLWKSLAQINNKMSN